MKRLLQELLFLKSGERRALFTVSILLFLSLVFRGVIPHIAHVEPEPDHVFLERTEELKQILDSLGMARRNSSTYYAAPIPVIHPAEFNPNTVTRAELMKMDLPGKVISNIIRYRDAGGYFSAPEDLKKIYGMDEDVYAVIHDYIRIEKKPSVDSSSFKTESERLILPELIELNAADSAELVKIWGIGPSYARRIIKYRSLLGGYHAFSQLWEVYGMDSTRFDLLSATVYIDSTQIAQMDINKLSFGELLRHPYLSKELVIDLIHYRDYAKRIAHPDELEKFQIIDSVSYRKIIPYLKCGIN